MKTDKKAPKVDKRGVCPPPMKENPPRMWFVFGPVDFSIEARARLKG